ncbi:hypothetical protein TanjilG_19424 [Lupinus angustifolius]|uniref:Transmembrane protein n=1 Tax=Lupinus angustifolius TaxID=3871 RepID=A0A4P1R543_LUPAN|nr:PREDICTED: uncharacterized protein LOC109359408 [Lupinus angustifolius]OIW01498.1 hypothetical protein TanjilG_19424 [Lupinus angustifolius]
MLGFTITSLFKPSLTLLSNPCTFSSSASSFSSNLQPFPQKPKPLLVLASNNNNSDLKEQEKQQQQPTNGEEQDVNNNNSNSSKQKIPIFSFNWRAILDPDPENILALGLTGLLTWASVQVLWQLLFISLAILLSALKYSFIAALLLFILIALL